MDQSHGPDRTVDYCDCRVYCHRKSLFSKRRHDEGLQSLEGLAIPRSFQSEPRRKDMISEFVRQALIGLYQKFTTPWLPVVPTDSRRLLQAMGIAIYVYIFFTYMLDMWWNTWSVNPSLDNERGGHLKYMKQWASCTKLDNRKINIFTCMWFHFIFFFLKYFIEWL